MKNFIQIDNKKIEISEETANNLKEQFSLMQSSDDVAMGSYKLFSEIDWEEEEEILIKDKLIKKIFVNKKFSDGSVFGVSCVFIKCKFGADCEFGFGCEFGSDCEKQKPYWDENGKHE